MSSYATGNDHKLDSVATSRNLGQQAPVNPSSSQSVQMAQVKPESKGGPWSRAIKGETESSTRLAPKEQTIKLFPQDRSNVGDPGSRERARYRRWREKRIRQGLPVE